MFITTKTKQKNLIEIVNNFPFQNKEKRKNLLNKKLKLKDYVQLYIRWYILYLIVMIFNKVLCCDQFNISLLMKFKNKTA